MDYTKEQLESKFCEFLIDVLQKPRPQAFKRPSHLEVSARATTEGWEEFDKVVNNKIANLKRREELNLILDLAKHLELELPASS